MINVGNIQVREGASIPKAQHGTMTKGLAPAEYNIGIDPLVGPWESLSDLEAYMISSGRKDKQGNPLFINGQETTIVGSDGIPHKYIRSNGAWLAMNYSGGGSSGGGSIVTDYNDLDNKPIIQNEDEYGYVLEGYCNAPGSRSFAQGDGTASVGECSHAEGVNCGQSLTDITVSKSYCGMSGDKFYILENGETYDLTENV